MHANDVRTHDHKAVKKICNIAMKAPFLAVNEVIQLRVAQVDVRSAFDGQKERSDWLSV